VTRLRTASRTHLDGIDEHFLATLDRDELAVIETTMLRLAERAGPGGEHDHCAVGRGRDAGDAADAPDRDG
jgi:hypothetical protein